MEYYAVTFFFQETPKRLTLAKVASLKLRRIVSGCGESPNLHAFERFLLQLLLLGPGIYQNDDLMHWICGFRRLRSLFFGTPP